LRGVIRRACRSSSYPLVQEVRRTALPVPQVGKQTRSSGRSQRRGSHERGAVVRLPRSRAAFPLAVANRLDFTRRDERVPDVRVATAQGSRFTPLR